MIEKSDTGHMQNKTSGGRMKFKCRTIDFGGQDKQAKTR
jgi:hypothetical protein